MRPINVGRWLLGGIVAGIIVDVFEFILNGVILGERWSAVMAAMNRPEFGGGEIAIFNIYGLVVGITAVWIYAGIRPRFGAGPKTAVYAAIATWILSYLLPAVSNVTMVGLPIDMVAIGTVFGLVEIIVATVVGAYIYKEEPA